MNNLIFMIIVKAAFGLIVGLVIFMCAKMYCKYITKKSMPENLGYKIFVVVFFMLFFFVHTIFAIVIILLIYFIALIFGKRNFTFSKFIFAHVPIAVIILALMSFMGVAMKTQY